MKNNLVHFTEPNLKAALDTDVNCRGRNCGKFTLQIVRYTQTFPGKFNSGTLHIVLYKFLCLLQNSNW